MYPALADFFLQAFVNVKDLKKTHVANRYLPDAAVDFLYGAVRKKGVIKTMPIEFIIYTFFGLVTFPLLSRPLIGKGPFAIDISRDGSLQEWKKNVVRQMIFLLTGKGEHCR